MRITAIIMCSGFGRRMGANKLLMPINGKRMFEYVFETIQGIGFYKTVVVTPYEEIKKYAQIRGFEATFNSENEEGIAASVRIGAGLCGDAEGIMYFTADQPFIDAETINRLLFEFEKNNKITVPVLNGKNKNPVIFPVRYKNDLLSLSGDVGGRQIINANKADVTKVFFKIERPFIDIDTAKDFEKL
ncbi:MAG: nucleotidyltransferase family protein [Candidatus Metalachnospira sp.]|nr:nucleotidyltransferase family protein [Candidatus Metalachnospira sp.]